MSQQLEDLAREKMPRRLTPEDVSAMEARDAAGYRKQPPSDDEASMWQSEQVWDDE